ncbi:alpha/beta hydrolase [Chelativorans sp. AA-79]|uniref:alpha/beta hydrolase n=1 Tax=Chelativorans sp. AA-79 TaxID=3028735 RepID=UPI0023FA2E22|nr:alpha/beta hydrolase [Chelativorans sp. AA-79]WEX11667.1 alpha/beta hydrolase [Chelativorans sp. AA-79]
MPSLLRQLVLSSAVSIALLATPALSLELGPFKDRLFAYPPVLESSDGGDYRVINYREMRDINGRDAVPERRVHGRYVATEIRRMQQDLVLKTHTGPVPHFAVGRTENARVITIYLHGQGGNRHQGVNDFTFGGNFNRIKNLMGRNGGLYLSPDFTDFEGQGATEILALLSYYAARSPRAPIFVACGSMGGALCWRIARSEALAPRLGGLLLLGSFWDDGFLGSSAFARRVPVFFGHGSRDTVFPVENQEAFYRRISKTPGYPARFVRFETGSHGTPIRMTDWRETLNWMLSVDR